MYKLYLMITSVKPFFILSTGYRRCLKFLISAYKENWPYLLVALFLTDQIPL